MIMNLRLSDLIEDVLRLSILERWIKTLSVFNASLKRLNNHKNLGIFWIFRDYILLYLLYSMLNVLLRWHCGLQERNKEIYREDTWFAHKDICQTREINAFWWSKNTRYQKDNSKHISNNRFNTAPIWTNCHSKTLSEQAEASVYLHDPTGSCHLATHFASHDDIRSLLPVQTHR